MGRAVKKTPCLTENLSRNVENLPILDERRVQVYESVQELRSAGYSYRKIAKALGISRCKVSDFIHGEFESLCQVKFRSGMDMFHDYIVKSLQAGMCRTDVYNCCVMRGYQGKRNAAYDYMNKLIRHYNIEASVYKSASEETVRKRKALQGYDYITRARLFRFIWMKEDLSPDHKDYLFKTYPLLYELDRCVREFRRIFNENRMPLLYMFIYRYRQSGINALSVFATGLERDIDAVVNAVSFELSNGFVEGSVSKLKMIKRVMYGRCRRVLLAAKMIYDVNG